jgi:hypothetical protein
MPVNKPSVITYAPELGMHVHKLVRKVAIEMAGQMYDDVMTQNNDLYVEWKRQCPDLTPERLQIMWIELAWPQLVLNGSVRATLARLLTTSLDPDLKREIYDALVKDATLRRGRPDLARQGPPGLPGLPPGALN